MKIVRCNDCDWIGREEELDIVEVSENGVDVYGYERCPNCFCPDAIMDVESGCFFDDQQLRTLWEIFGDIPMNPATEEIEENFLDFPAGTHREEIWHWFDERYGGGVHALMEV